MSSSSTLVQNLNAEVNAFKSNVSASVAKVETATNEIKVTTQKVYDRVDAFKKTMLEGEEKSIATENILKIDQKINEQLSYYLTIRRSVTGIVKDLDFNLVRKSTIAELSEELWMSSSRYWLSYALIALNAWIQDNSEIAANAVNETLRKDRVKGSLFFCLLSLRFGRHEAAKKWLFEYFNAVDPINPPEESALLLQAFLMGVFGSDAIIESAVKETIDGWVNEIQSSEGISAELSAMYLAFLSTLPSKPSKDYESLKGHCVNYGQLTAALTGANRFTTALNLLTKLDTAEEFKVERSFIEQVDEVLSDLMNNYDDEERQLRNEQKYYQLIVDNDGDVEAAKKQFEAVNSEAKSVSNIGRQMLGWAIAPAKGTSPAVSKFAVQKTKGWYSSATDSYAAALKSENPKGYELKIDLWSGVTDGKDVEGTKNNLEETFKAQRNSLLVFNKANVILGVLAIVAALASILLGALWNPIAYAGLGVAAIFIAIILIKTILSVKKFPKRIAAAVDILYKCFDEITAYTADLAALTDVKEKVKEKLYYI